MFDPEIVKGVDEKTRYTLGASGGYTMLRQGGQFGDLYGRHFPNRCAGPCDRECHYTFAIVRRQPRSAIPTRKLIAGWNNTFTFDRFSVGVLIDGKFGGTVLSITQGYLDQLGVSQRTADARNNGNTVTINNAVDEGGHGWSGTVDAKTYYQYIGGKNACRSCVFLQRNSSEIARALDQLPMYLLMEKW